MRRTIALAIAAGIAAALVACGDGSPPTQPTNGGGGGGGTTNTPPTIASITASDTRVEVGAPVTLTAVVQDAETPVDKLTYAWSVPNGQIDGQGAVVAWTPGSDATTPADFTVTLTVTELYTSGSLQLRNTATGTISVHVNNSQKELADLSVRFLTDFAHSNVSPDTCVSEFSSGRYGSGDLDCASGKAAEFQDIDDNRHDFQMIAYTLRPTSLSINPNKVFATVHTFCSFTAKVITTDPRDESCQGGKCPLGSVGTAVGDCWTTNVYEKGRWWLCASHFTSSSVVPNAFERAFFRIRGPG